MATSTSMALPLFLEILVYGVVTSLAADIELLVDPSSPDGEVGLVLAKVLHQF